MMARGANRMPLRSPQTGGGIACRGLVALLLCTMLWAAGCGRVTSQPQGSVTQTTTDSGDVVQPDQAALRLRFLEQVEQVRAGRSKSIDIDGFAATSMDLAAIAELPLTSVTLRECAATDDDMQYLRRCTSLTHLVLGDTTIGDRGLAALQDCRRLQSLNLNASTITDAGLVHVAAWPDLQSLRLGSSDIRGPGLAHLANLPGLRFLILQNAHLDDASLDNLAGCKSLESLYLEGNSMTGDGAERLKQSLPQLHVHL